MNEFERQARAILARQAESAGATGDVEWLNNLSWGQTYMSPESYRMLSIPQRRQYLQNVMREDPRNPLINEYLAVDRDPVESAGHLLDAIPAAGRVLAQLGNLERAKSEGFGANVRGAGRVAGDYLTRPGDWQMQEYLRDIGHPFAENPVFALGADVAVPGPGDFARAGAMVGDALTGVGTAVAGVLGRGPKGGSVNDLLSAFRQNAKATNVPDDEIDATSDVLEEHMLEMIEYNLPLLPPGYTSGRLIGPKDTQWEAAKDELMYRLESVGMDEWDAESLVDRIGVAGMEKTAAQNFYSEKQFKATAGPYNFELFRGYTADWTKDVIPTKGDRMQMGTLNPIDKTTFGGELSKPFIRRAVELYNPEKAADGATAFNYVLNGFLRYPEALITEFPNESRVLQNAIAEMDSVFTRNTGEVGSSPQAVLPEDTVLYRGTVLRAEWVPNGDPMNLVGNSLPDKGFMSFSDNPGVAMSFMGRGETTLPENYLPIFVVMDAPAQTPAVALGNISRIGIESELLLPRNTQIDILSMELRTTPWDVNYYLARGIPNFSASPLDDSQIVRPRLNR